MRTTRILLSIFCALCIGVLGLPVLADTGTASVPLDIMLVLDNSGSMRQNDPDMLTRAVVSTFSGMLATDSRLGLVLFDAEVVLALGLTTVDTPAFTKQIAHSLEQVNYQGQRTDLPAGVERALYELRENGRPQAQRVLVFLTDGLVDVGSAAKDLEQARWLREELAQEAKQLGIRVMGIAFTNAADFQLIQAVANTTGGRHYRILTASEIPRVFEKIAARIKEMAHAAHANASEQKTGSEVVWPSGWPSWWLYAAIAILVLGIAVVFAARFMRAGPATKESGVGQDEAVPEASLYDFAGHTDAQHHTLTKRVTKIGREDQPANDIVISHDTVSGNHAEIVWRDGTFYLRDLRSMNQSFLNGRSFSDPAKREIREVALKNRDRVKFDRYEFEFVVAEDEIGGGTRLASKGTVWRPQSPQGAPQDNAEAGQPAKDVPPSPSPGEDEPCKTAIKSGMCPNHTSWNATELCTQCQQDFCKNCMKTKEGQAICVQCAAKTVGLSE